MLSIRGETLKKETSRDPTRWRSTAYFHAAPRSRNGRRLRESTSTDQATYRQPRTTLHRPGFKTWECLGPVMAYRGCREERRSLYQLLLSLTSKVKARRGGR